MPILLIAKGMVCIDFLIATVATLQDYLKQDLVTGICLVQLLCVILHLKSI